MAQQKPPDIMDDDQFYDYDAAIKSGAKPDKSGHWPSNFKKPGHPNEIVGGFNTRTGQPEPGHKLELNPDELMKSGWNPKTALEMSRKYSNEDIPPDILDESIIEQKGNKNPISFSGSPDTFLEGFADSLTSGDALGAGLRGLKGFAKGSILDLPSSIYHGVKNAIQHPLDTVLSSMGPLGDVIGGMDTMAPIRSASENAGNEPEAFGRLMGQLTGQPAVTGGMIKAAPSIAKGIGRLTEGTGNIMKNHAPLSGMIPKMIEPRIVRTIEQSIGNKISNLGSRMQSDSRIINNENLAGYKSNIKPSSGRNYPSAEPLNIPRVLITGDDLADYMMEYKPDILKRKSRANLSKNDAMPFEKSIITNEDYADLGSQAANTSGYVPKSYKVIRNDSVTPASELMEGQDLSQFAKPRRKITTNGDGTFTDVNTGEMFDSKGQSIIEIDKKPINLKKNYNLNESESQKIQSNLNKKIKINQPDYVSELLEYTDDGIPGLSIKDMHKPLDPTKYRINQEIAYRNNQGKPIAVARIVKHPNGKIEIRDFVGDKTKGLAYGRAVKEVGNKLREMGALEAETTISPDAVNLINKLGNKPIDKNSSFFTRNRR